MQGMTFRRESGLGGQSLAGSSAEVGQNEMGEWHASEGASLLEIGVAAPAGAVKGFSHEPCLLVSRVRIRIDVGGAVSRSCHPRTGDVHRHYLYADIGNGAAATNSVPT